MLKAFVREVLNDVFHVAIKRKSITTGAHLPSADRWHWVVTPERGVMKGHGPSSYAGYSRPGSLEALLTGWVTRLLGGD